MAPPPSKYLPTPALWAALLAAYFVAGKLGLKLAFVNPSASAVWPAAGIALAALLILGLRLWPLILAGAFLFNVTTAGSALTSIGIAVGNTLEAVTAAWLVQRFAGGRHAFERPRDVFRYAALAGLVGPAVSASFGVTSLSLGGFAAWPDFPAIWLTWWLGDVGGELVVAPLLVVWGTEPRLRWERRRASELALLALCLTLIGLGMFGKLPFVGVHSMSFLCLPPLLWAGFRFGSRGAATATALLSAIAIWAAMHASGPFVRPSPNESLLLLQAFMVVMSVTSLAVAAAVTQRVLAEEALRRLEQAVETLPLGVTISDNQGRILYTNPFEAELHGYRVEELIGKHVGTFMPTMWQPAPGRPSETQSWRRETVNVRRDGTIFPVQLLSDVLRAKGGAPIGIVTCCEEITERKRAAQHVEFQAYHDPLTGLPNRIALRDRMSLGLARARRDGMGLVVMFLDLNDFKAINDRLGHALGDRLLRLVAGRLKDGVRGEDTVARVGGDEFVLLLSSVGLGEGAARIAEKLLNLLAESVRLDGHELRVTGSIGIALFPEDGEDEATLLRAADAAMYRAKRLGRGGYQFCRPASSPPVA